MLVPRPIAAMTTIRAGDHVVRYRLSASLIDAYAAQECL